MTLTPEQKKKMIEQFRSEIKAAPSLMEIKAGATADLSKIVETAVNDKVTAINIDEKIYAHGNATLDNVQVALKNVTNLVYVHGNETLGNALQTMGGIVNQVALNITDAMYQQGNSSLLLFNSSLTSSISQLNTDLSDSLNQANASWYNRLKDVNASIFEKIEEESNFALELINVTKNGILEKLKSGFENKTSNPGVVPGSDANFCKLMPSLSDMNIADYQPQAGCTPPDNSIAVKLGSDLYGYLANESLCSGRHHDTDWSMKDGICDGV